MLKTKYMLNSSESPEIDPTEIEKLMPTRTNVVSVLQGIRPQRSGTAPGSTTRVLKCGAQPEWLTLPSVVDGKHQEKTKTL